MAVACGGGGGNGTETEATAASTDGTGAGPTTMSSETASTGGPTTTAGPTTDTTAGPTTGPTTGPGTSGPTTDTTAGPTTDPGTTTNTTGPDTTTGAGDDSTLCASQAEGLFFPADAIWYHDASSDPVASDSAAITQWMVQNSPPNGWGTGTMRIDFSITAIDAPAGTEKRTYELDNDYYYSPDCDVAPIPLPPGGVVEDYPQDIPPADSFEGYDCSGYQDGADCHMIVVSRSSSGSTRSTTRPSTRSPISSPPAASRCGTPRRPTTSTVAASSAPAPTRPASRSRRCCSRPRRSRPARSTTRSGSSCPTR
ncbi:hypothetical protein [Nannocystis pusilla]|uniref:hypothetical protein n=1 Tax=Nannocystis pusilla TaxID=889268 RepID=UPI003B7B78E1